MKRAAIYLLAFAFGWLLGEPIKLLFKPKASAVAAVESKPTPPTIEELVDTAFEAGIKLGYAAARAGAMKHDIAIF